MMTLQAFFKSEHPKCGLLILSQSVNIYAFLEKQDIPYIYLDVLDFDQARFTHVVKSKSILNPRSIVCIDHVELVKRENQLFFREHIFPTTNKFVILIFQKTTWSPWFAICETHVPTHLLWKAYTTKEIQTWISKVQTKAKKRAHESNATQSDIPKISTPKITTPKETSKQESVLTVITQTTEEIFQSLPHDTQKEVYFHSLIHNHPFTPSIIDYTYKVDYQEAIRWLRSRSHTSKWDVIKEHIEQHGPKLIRSLQRNIPKFVGANEQDIVYCQQHWFNTFSQMKSIPIAMEKEYAPAFIASCAWGCSNWNFHYKTTPQQAEMGYILKERKRVQHTCIQQTVKLLGYRLSEFELVEERMGNVESTSTFVVDGLVWKDLLSQVKNCLSQLDDSCTT